MKRIGWFSLVFLVSVLAGLPANWLLAPMAAQGVSGSLWQGQAQRLGQVGPLAWHWQPWRLQAQVNLGFQGQDWQLKVAGWPWNWTAAVEPLQRTLAMPLSYRLTGEWTGRIEVQGSGRQCQGSQGEIAGHNLALVAPWSVPLGATRVRVDCSVGMHLLAQLQLQGQHQFELDADLRQRRGRLQGAVEPGATLAPVLLSAQWLKPDDSRLSRRLKW
ncbi:type II secretion system protein N [Pseudomonas donghuensis]|uniref:Type II secretion system protein N n=1 Tax=Pseudomonas donghuensis TaxID=1163398 RepID=A0AAP0SLX7_9PSED|nr:type II secretion system protein N [Pseudomonas donghuensis]MDF9892015.1 general secretion pathway protein N [Pseudomonas vranovensis]KDO01487.1 type II secretion system protein N [Pseudomonas donghuensis]MCP6691553.1 type II secretion system protein N [Pseudomonas donghuensis]MCP6695322.1 type II secretion system protein N [Pseudomonas donghuensis]PJY97432.1 general secretion pathway protein GspN [Pseudomonas donghuensis]